MTIKLIPIIALISGLLFMSCLRQEDIVIDGPGDAKVSMTIEKSFGDDASQMIKVIIQNKNGELSELEDGFVKFNNIILDWNYTTKAYYADATYTLQEHSLNTFEIEFPNGDESINDIQIPYFFENVEIPMEININENTEIAWDGGDQGEEVLVIVWVRPLEMESWEALLKENTPDDGSFVILSSLFDVYMGNWQVAVEIAREIQGEPDPFLLDNSELYSLFVFGNYSGNLVHY